MWLRQEIQTVPRQSKLGTVNPQVSAIVQQIHVAAGVLVNPEGEILIAQRQPGTHMAGAWEFPGGKIAAAETPLQGLVRELDEELGIQVRYARYLTRFQHVYPERVVQLYIWKVLVWEGAVHSREGQPLRWIRPEELGQAGLLPADQQIIDVLQEHSAVNALDAQKFMTVLSG